MTIESGTLEFNIILGITIAVLVVKLLLISVMGITILKKHKKQGFLAQDFLMGVFLLVLFLFISRTFYFIFDFVITKFDMDLYPYPPQVWYWKLGQFFAAMGILSITAIMERKIMKGKYKGIFVIIILIGAIVGLVYPINNMSDFNIVSTISIIPALAILIVPFTFLKIGMQSSGLMKKTSYLIFVAILLYSIAALLVNAALITALEPVVGENIDMYMYLIRGILKISALMMLSYGATKFQLS